MSLYYSPEKGLTRNFKGATRLIPSHELEEKQQRKATIPDSNISIVVESNFGAKYPGVYAKMYAGDNSILYFGDTRMQRIITGITVSKIDKNALYISWNELFEKIIGLYRSMLTDEYTIDIVTYFDVLDELIRGEVEHVQLWTLDHSHCSALSVAMQRVGEIADIVSTSSFYTLHAEEISNRLKKSCNLLVSVLMDNAYLLRQLKEKKYDGIVEKNLTSAFNYLHQDKRILDILLDIKKSSSVEEL